MEEFVLLFRMDHGSKAQQASPDQMQDWIKEWQDWMGGIAAQNKLISSGNRLNADGMVVKPNNVVTNGPYVETKETIGGFIIVKAKDYDEAVEFAKGCPILLSPWDGNVEVRAIAS